LSRWLKRVVAVVLGFLRRPLEWLASTARSLTRKAWRRLFGKAIDKRRERKARKMAERQAASAATPPPQRGTTVFSTRGQP
jgi:hypothetical protein